MWFLTCDGKHLNNKRKWLRPGTSLILGRVKDVDPESNAIANKSVSRKHVQISISEVEQGSGSDLIKRSTATIEPLQTRTSTTINQKLITEATIVTGRLAVIQLGTYAVNFRLEWTPLTFTFNIHALPRKADDPLAVVREALEPLDIKCSTEHVSAETTHVVSKKRNTLETLLALLEAKPCVTKEYVNAVVEATILRPDPKHPDEQTSPLQMDFDLNWPKEHEYLPGPGREANPRPELDPIFQPNPDRAMTFTDYAFIFWQSEQYDTWIKILTAGGGKAVPPPVGTSTIRESLAYIREFASKKVEGIKHLSKISREKGGVLIVRSPEAGTDTNLARFFDRLDRNLGQKSITHGDFLEAILQIDASVLRKDIEPEDDEEEDQDTPANVTTDQPATTATATGDDDQRPASQKPEASQPSSSAAQEAPPSTYKRRVRRHFIKPKNDELDDFDPNQMIKYSQPTASQVASSQLPADLPSDDDMQVAQTQQSQSQSVNLRKRPATTQLQPLKSKRQIMDEQLEGFAAVQKRRLEQDQNGQAGFPDAAAEEERPKQEESKTARTKAVEDADIKKAMKQRREEQDRKGLENEAELKEAMQGMTTEQMKGLAQVEVMEIRPRRPLGGTSRAADSGTDVSPHWKPEWNGRANFKSFKKRRPGETHTNDDGPARRKVIVELEPWHKGSGVRDEEDWFLLPPRRSDKSSPSKQSASQRARPAKKRRNIDPENEDDDDDTQNPIEADTPATADLRRRIEQSRIDDAREDELTELLPEEVGGVPRDEELRTQIARKQSQEAAARKTQRASTKTGAGTSALPGKRRRVPPSEESDDDDDDDDDDEEEEGGLQFRRRRRA